MSYGFKDDKSKAQVITNENDVDWFLLSINGSSPTLDMNKLYARRVGNTIEISGKFRISGSDLNSVTFSIPTEFVPSGHDIENAVVGCDSGKTTVLTATVSGLVDGKLALQLMNSAKITSTKTYCVHLIYMV